MSARVHPMVTILRSNAAALQRPRLRAPRPRGPLGTEFDPFAKDVIADPPAAYRRLHESGGVHRCRRRRLYVLADYEDVRTAARAHDVLSSARGVSRVPAALPMMLTADRPRHGELRRLVAPYFTAEAALTRRPLMERVTADAIEWMLASPAGDAVRELAVPLPITVIAELPRHPVARPPRPEALVGRRDRGLPRRPHPSPSCGAARGSATTCIRCTATCCARSTACAAIPATT